MIDPKDLRNIKLFENLVHSHLMKIASIVEVEEVAPSTHIFSDGDAAERFYCVLKGKVRISKQVPGMGEEALAILETGDYFGEMALVDTAPRSADAITNTTVRLGVIEKREFEALLFTHKDLAHDMLWTFVRTLSRRVRESNDKMRAFLTMAGQF